MRSSFLFVRLLLVLASISLISLVSALTYPTGAPAGETTGGTYRTYFDNMFPGCSIVGDVIASFTSTGVPVCITPAATGLNMYGLTGYTLYYNGTVWTGSANIYNNNGNVGIGMTPGASSGKLQVNGQIMITGGTPGAGKFLVSDAGGLASWQSTSASLSGTYWSLSGNTVGSNDYIGTLNDRDLVMRRNNIQVARFMGTGNLAIGENALIANTTAVYNTAIGSGALRNNTTGSSNTANGMEALLSNTSGFGNIANGVGALRYNTTGWQNTAIGGLALEDNISGQQNTAIGQSALANNTTGFQNTAIGQSALISNITGGYNTANGYSSLANNGIGNGNVAMGYESLFSSTGISFQTAVGYQALRNSTTGNGNSAFGNQALFSNTTGNYNVAIGSGALRGNTTGSYNTANGYQALTLNTTGYSNVADGSNALQGNTTGSGNVGVGYYAGSNLTTGNYNIAIGMNTSFPSISADNQLNIGNWIYGSGGNIGIGATVPGQKLTVSGGTIQIINGSQGSGRILVSDANGVASWQSTTPSLSGTYWSLSGNTVGVNDYIGSNNARDLILKTNNIERMRITSGGNILGMGSLTPSGINNIAIGNNAGFSMTGTYNFAFGGVSAGMAMEGTANIAIGGFAAGNAMSGLVNTAIGGSQPGLFMVGTNNTALGGNAAGYGAGGGYNVFLGGNYGGTNLSANYDTTLGGLYAGYGMGGNYNTAIGGQYSGYGMGGTKNIAIGSYAGSNMITGNNNVYIGSYAVGNTSQDDQFSIGNVIYGSGMGTGGLTNGRVGIGTMAPSQKLTISGGTIQIIDGNQGVGKILTSDANGVGSWVSAAASSNSWLVTGNGGTAAGTNFVGTTDAQDLVVKTNGVEKSRIYATRTTSGYIASFTGGDLLVNNISIGAGSGGSIEYNTVLGLRALSSYIPTGFQSYNTALGSDTLAANTTGVENTALGSNALVWNTLGSENTALGVAALYQNVSGNYNTAVGYLAGYQNIGSKNTSLGFSALSKNISGTDNVALGYDAAGNYGSASGPISRNTIIGSLAGRAMLANSNDNVLIGYKAGTNLTTGVRNTLVGTILSAGTVTTGNDNISLGYNALVVSGALSNQLNIGNWIYGSGGNIGIGATVPGQKLTVSGAVQIIDGTQGAGKFLVSDASGIASWQSTTASLSGTYWSLSGNTIGVNDYIGSNNTQDLVIKTNNTEKMRILSATSSTGVLLYLGGDAIINGITVGRGSGSDITNTVFGNGGLKKTYQYGTDNTAIGYTALSNNMDAWENTAVGAYSLLNNTGGSYNTALGASSLNANTIGLFNTAIGRSALSANMNGGGNTAVGWGSQGSNLTGIYNSSIGLGSLSSTSGNGNTAIGTSSITYTDSNSSQNSAVGMASLAILGSNNSALGYMAGSNTGRTLTATTTFLSISNTTGSGSNNTFLGGNTRFFNSPITNATAVGANVVVYNSNTLILGSGANVGIGTSIPGQKLTVSGGTIQIIDGTQGVGKFLVSDASGIASWQSTTASLSGTYWSLSGNTIGANDYIGSNNAQALVIKTNNTEKMRILSSTSSTGALLFVNGGDAVINGLTVGRGSGQLLSNLAVGSDALKNNTFGFVNTAIGSSALLGNTSGAFNTAIGSNTLQYNTTGVSNTANGASSLNQNTTGSYNTSNGVASLYGNTIGIGNVAMGTDALMSSTGVSFQTAIGYQALRNSTTGTQNLAIGYGAGSGITTGSNNIAIGYGAQVPTGTASNQLNIGNWIYGNGGNIGVGTSTGTAKLTVAGTALITSDLTVQGKVISDTFVNRTVNNVTISGSLLPDLAAPLIYRDIGNNTTQSWNNLYLSGQVTIKGGTPGVDKVLTSDAAGLATWQDVPTSVNNWSTTGNAGTSPGTNFLGTTDFQPLLLYTNGTERMRIHAMPTTRGELINISGGDANINGVTVGLGKGQIYSNTVIGYSSLNTNITGFNNTTNGANTLQINTSGNNNTAMGFNSLQANDIGSNNTANGAYALSANATGSGNIAIGTEALYTATGVDFQTAVGYQALRNSTTGYGNAALGYRALYSNTSGFLNTALGNQALYSNTSGYSNVAVGSGALFSNTTGRFNVAIGSLALNSNTIGQFNTAIGVYALMSNTGGVYNTAVGLSALYSNTTGIQNTANGNYALNANTTGRDNTANGMRSLYNNTTGSSNTAYGLNSLFANTTGAYNAAFGNGTLIQNITGTGNVAVGSDALTSSTGVSFQTAIGYQALKYSTTGTQNLAIGYSAGSGITTGSNNIAIGYDAQVPSGTASNQLNIGNWIYGNGGNIGIGTSAPSTKFHVVGSVRYDLGGDVFGDMYFRGGGVTAPLTRIPLGSAGQVLTVNGTTPTWTTGFSGTTTASGITGGTANYVPKFGPGGNGLVNSNLFDQGTAVSVGVPLGAGYIFEIWSGAVNYLHFRGTNNIGMGAGALRIATTGNANTAFGNESLYTLTSGYSNSAFGHQALRQSTSGFNNSAFGKEAMYNDNDGTWNTAIGYQALRVATSSDYNIAIGGQSLYNLGTGSGNVAVGHNALYGATSTTSNNTALGYMAGSGITSGWGNIAIGYAVQVPSNTASNQMNIGNWIYGSGGNIGIGTGASSALTTRLNIDGGANNVSGLRMNRLSNTSTTYTGASVGLGVDSAGNVVPISNGDVVVYTAGNPASPPTPNPDIANRDITYDYNKYFDIPTAQSFVVSDGTTTSYNGPFFRENGTTGVCSWNGTYGTSPYACSGNDTYGVPASPANSFTMTAKGTTYGYQLALGARGDAPLFARSGRFNGAVGGGLYTNDSPYQTPAPWQRVLTVPANHNEYFYINTGFNSQLQAISGGGMIGFGTTKPSSMVTLSGSAFPTITALTTTGSYLGLGSYASTNIMFDNDSMQAKSNATTAGPFYMNPYGGNVNIGGTSVPSSQLEVNGTFKLGTAGTQISAAGVCTTAATTVSNSVPAVMTCTGVPASTSVALSCNGSAAFTVPASTALYCRANGTASSITCNTTQTNAVSMTYTCKWMQ